MLQALADGETDPATVATDRIHRRKRVTLNTPAAVVIREERESA